MVSIGFVSERMASRTITIYYIALESAIDGRAAKKLIPAGNFCR
jgi:hypothetical protein